MSGPYMNEDGDWWVPVDGTSLRQARAEVVACLHFSIPEDGRLAYLGKVTTRVTDHEYGCQCDPTCYREVLAYHFEERLPW